VQRTAAADDYMQPVNETTSPPPYDSVVISKHIIVIIVVFIISLPSCASRGLEYSFVFKLDGEKGV